MCKPRGLPCRELINATVEIYWPKFENIITKDRKRNGVMARYTANEMRLYQEGTLDAARWRDEASKFWWELRNPNDEVHSNYGYLTDVLLDAPGTWDMACAMEDHRVVAGLITQWEWALACLKADRDTRQAIMHFNRPIHQYQGNKDFPCTMYGIFRILDNVLWYTVRMRSQDVVKGFPYDVLYFIWQQEQMANALHCQVGTFTLSVDSLHVYLKDIGTVQRMLGC